MTPAEFNPMDPELERAMSEIRKDDVDPSVIEAAAARVWSSLSAEARNLAAGSHIHDCSEFQALIPEYRSRTLPAARATLQNFSIPIRRIGLRYENTISPVDCACCRISAANVNTCASDVPCFSARSLAR